MRGLIAVLLGLLLIAGCSSATTSAPTATTTVDMADWTVPPTVKFDAYDLPAGQRIEAGFDVTERHNYSPRNSAQRDTVAILRQVASSYPAANFVLITGYADVKDRFGNANRKTVLNVGYDAATIARINFADINPSDIWEIKDGGMGYTGD